MTILEKISKQKRSEVESRKAMVSSQQLEKKPFFERPVLSLCDSLRRKGSSGIIAEFKRRSPSKGVLNDTASVEEVVRGYASGGAAGISVLTETAFFSGSDDDLLIAGKLHDTPLLRKDFIIDEYQIIEARSLGADVILLIAALLSQEEIKLFASLAHRLDMQVLLEVHSKEELERSLIAEIDIVGVNNRNLSDFTVSIQTSYELAPLIPDEFLKVSESAISAPNLIAGLRRAGFDGFLIGETFMKTQNPVLAFKEFMQDIQASGVID